MRAPMPSKMDTLFGNQHHHQDPRLLAAAAAAQYGLNQQHREVLPVSLRPCLRRVQCSRVGWGLEEAVSCMD